MVSRPWSTPHPSYDTVALKRRIESGEVDGPRIYRRPRSLSAQWRAVLCERRRARRTVDVLLQPSTPREARDIVRSNIRGGADLIKLFTGSNVASKSVCRCLAMWRRPLLRKPTCLASSCSRIPPASRASMWRSRRGSTCWPT